MNPDSITRYIAATFDGVDVFPSNGTTFFFYDPTRMFPFATLVTNDDHDNASDLNRESVFRLNIGVSKATFLSLFDTKPARSRADGIIEGDYNFTALDQIMPHPVYGSMYWVCVLNPSAETFETVKILLAEAYQMAVKKLAKTQNANES